MILARAEFETPVGKLTALSHEGGLCALSFDENRYDPVAPLIARFGTVETASGDPLDVVPRFRDYLDGGLEMLDSLPVDMGGTPFQRRVWAVLRTIPAGRTLSYLEVAQRVGAPDAVRAVGAANGRNPVAIVVPCHRVIGANGQLVGYGGGLERKRWLLTHERARVPALTLAQPRLFE